MATKPRLLIIGHGRHGKDAVAELLRDNYGLKFKSSSLFVGEEAIWPMWGSERYNTFQEMYDDRHTDNNRAVWKGLIKAYNTPDLTRTAREMYMQGFDMYVGMRDREEFEAGRKAGLFDLVIWVDACDRKPLTEDLDLNKDDADYVIDNNGPQSDLTFGVHRLFKHIEDLGYQWEKPMTEFTSILVKVQEQEKGASKEDDKIDLSVMPEGAIPLLDHGYIKLVDVMGTDADIAAAARLSYGRGTTKVNKDEGLIRYLYTNHHTSPFEMCELKVQMRLPIFVMRQLVRQRTANLNEYSGRYSIIPELWYIPDVKRMQKQSVTNKQGSSDEIILEAELARRLMDEQCRSAYNLYEQLISEDTDLSRELARMILPQNMYTEVVWKLDLNNLFKFLWLRDDSHAQWEIRVYAQEISKMVQEHWPLAYAAYMRSRNSVTLTQDQLRAILTGNMQGLPKGEATKVDQILRDHNTMMQKVVFEELRGPDSPWADGPVKVAP